MDVSQNVLYIGHKIGFCNARWLENLLGSQSVDSIKTPKPLRDQLPLVRANDGIERLACAFLEHAPGLPHVYDGIAQVGWPNLSLFGDVAQ